MGRLHHALADRVLVQPRRELSVRRLTMDSFHIIVAPLGEPNERREYLEALRVRA